MITRRPFVLASALSLAALVPTLRLGAQSVGSIVSNANAYNGARSDDQERYSANQIDNLVGPIALYPDALLAQVLVASTFPDQVEDAARFVRANGTRDIDDQSWDISVKAVAHYASALNSMADKPDWTATLGRAYANQSSDVMASVQRLRNQAASQGNLMSTREQQVVRDNDNYVIVPTQPRVIYVPVYDPYVIYSRPIFNVGFSGRYWSYGVGFPIGSWLTYDCDWGLRTVYYNGWNDNYIAYGGGWRGRSRPFIQFTNVYVNPRYRTVYVNRDVGRRVVDYRNVDRYPRVHQDTWFDRNRGDGRNDNRGNENRGGYRSGDNRGNDNRGNDNGGNTGRIAQPRGERPVATPDGYRNGGNRDAGNRDNGNRDNGNRDNGNRGERAPIAAPERRRSEPLSRGQELTVDPQGGRRPRPDEARQEPVRQEPPRVEVIRPEPRREPRPEQVQPQSAPRQEQVRQDRRGVGEQRSAQPRPERSGQDAGPRDGDKGGKSEKGDRGGDRGRDRRGL